MSAAPDSRFQDLRERAEALLGQGGSPPGTPPDLQRLLHDLAVHQIELELQNEELQAAQLRSERLLARFQDLYHQAPVGFLTLDSVGLIQECNATFATLVGRPAADLQNTPLADLLDPQGRAIFLARYRPLLQQPEGKELEARLKERQTVLRFTFRADAAHPSTRLLVAAQNVSGEMESREQVREREERLDLFHRTCPDAIVLTDLETGHLMEVNPAFEALFQVVRESVIGHSLPQALGSEICQWAPLMARLREHGRLDRELLTFKRQDGADLVVEANLVLTRHHGRACSVGIWRDITQQVALERTRRELETQLRQSQKLESLGSLAGGVAHDMNNVLMAILGLGTALLSMEPPDSPRRRSLETITRACEKGGRLVRGLLNFARQGAGDFRALDLNALLREEVALLERTTLSRVQIVLDLGENLPAVLGDPAALSHALMNLCVNAVDAMEPGGTLTLHTQSRGEWVHACVEDTGTGMPPDILAKALDPYFTTKPEGKGTGLGLSMAYGTLKAHGGNLVLESTPGQGTRVTLILPAHREAPAVNAPAPCPGSRSGTHALMLVDDDDLVRDATATMLESLGHHVRTCSGGRMALECLRDGARAELVLLDMNMPDMGGAETLQHMRQQHPDLPVLLVTGRADQEAQRLAASLPRVGLLPKPFSLDALSRALLGLLSTEARG